MEDQETCYSPGSVAGAVIGTFLTTCLLLAVAGLLYRRWRRNKGKHLVLVTDPEIVDEAYAFDNPCFKDATPAMGRSLERPVSTISASNEKHHHHDITNTTTTTTTTTATTSPQTRWSTPWANIGKSADKRRTLDDSCLTPKTTRVSVVGLRSRDFTGLGFSVCGNMREGIFVKDLMHRGPASESGRIHPGDRISSVKISFRSMVYEDALTILSYASPYDVELEVESGGGSGSKPTTLLKKSVGPSPTRLCHPLYRSQSIPDLSQTPKHTRQRLFDDSSTLKSTKSTPGSQTLERQEKVNHHTKFGIKVLPALDGTAHRVVDQNEHNTNLERRHSKKMEAAEKLVNETSQQRSNVEKKVIHVTDGHGMDVPDRAAEVVKQEDQPTIVIIPDDVPAEVHNAAMAARGKRKSSSSELLQKAAQELAQEPPVPSVEPQPQLQPVAEAKSPQKGKRKAPAPPSRSTSVDEKTDTQQQQQPNGDVVVSVDAPTIETPTTEPSPPVEPKSPSIATSTPSKRHTSESDTDSEIQHSSTFTTIELNPSDITIHHTPVPESHDEEEEEEDDDVYRKAASLGDLSKYETNKTPSTLERAQSLDMTDPGAKKRNKSAAATQPPEDISESTEDLTKIGAASAAAAGLKKSSEWGTLGDAIFDERTRKKSPTALERSQSDAEAKREDGPEAGTSRELYNLPLSKRLSREFIEAERLFDIGEDNALARLVNDGRVVKSPTPEELEQQLTGEHPVPDDEGEFVKDHASAKEEPPAASRGDEEPSFERAVRYFVEHAENGDFVPDAETIVGVPEPPEKLYAGRREVVEEPLTKVTLRFGCPGCDDGHERHAHGCAKKKREAEFETHYAKPISLDDEAQLVTTKPSYVTEIKVSQDREEEEAQSDEEIVAILEPKAKPQQPNGKLPKKPPVPPRRADAPRFVKTEDEDRQVVYVSEYRMREREPDKRYESSWAHLQDEQEINPWGNGSSPSQPVTSIVLGEEKAATAAAHK